MADRVIRLLVSVLEHLGAFFYAAERSRAVRWTVFIVVAIVFFSLVPVHQMRTEDTTIYGLPASYLRATMVNKYVQTTGKLITNGAYQLPATDNGITWYTKRFIPFLTPNTREPLMVLDRDLPLPDANGDVSLSGKMMPGGDDEPQYYLQVMNPPSKVLGDVLFIVSVAILGMLVLGIGLSWLVRKANYVLVVPWGLADRLLAQNSVDDFILWSGSMGAGYADAVVRQVPVNMKAIPSEARFTPAGHTDMWAVVIHRLRQVQIATVATPYGALPSLRVVFEDERGITRDGVIATSHRKLIGSLLDVLRFVGQ